MITPLESAAQRFLIDIVCCISDPQVAEIGLDGSKSQIFCTFSAKVLFWPYPAPINLKLERTETKRTELESVILL